jgi:HlyD family secretion protein
MKALKRLGRWVVVLGVIAGVLALIGRLTKPPPIEVKTVAVERGAVREVATSSTAGDVVAERRASVRAELGARVVDVKHKRGDRVKRGEPIVLLDAADLEARLAQARASLEGARAGIDQAKARVVTLERQADRARTLAERGAGTAQLSEDAANLLAEAKEGVRQQSANLATAEAAVKVAAVARGRAELTAPFDGLLVDVDPDPGDELTPGALAFEIIDDTRLHVDAAVDEADAARVREGQEAALTLDALPGKRIAGRVTRIAPAIRRDQKGARTLPIEVEVSDPKAAAADGIKPGMSANVEIVLAEKPDVVWLPTHVIVGRGVKRTVYRVADGKVSRVEVEVGLANWERSEIVRGVLPGEKVVATLNVKGLDDGVLVKVVP